MLRVSKKFLWVGGGYPILIIVAALLDLWRTVVHADQESVSLIEGLNYLLLAEWVVILASARRVDWGRIRANRYELVLGLALVVGGRFSLAWGAGAITMLLCGQVGAKLALQLRMRWLGAAIGIVGFQNLLKEYLKPLHEAWTRVDALAVHWLLSATGYPNELHGIVVVGPREAIKIMFGCATTYTGLQVIAAFLIFSLCWGTTPAALTRGLALTLAGTWIVNVLRLALMVQSSDYYQYWHMGGGASIVSLAFAALAYFAAAAAAAPAEVIDSSPPVMDR